MPGKKLLNIASMGNILSCFLTFIYSSSTPSKKYLNQSKVVKELISLNPHSKIRVKIESKPRI